ncbi:hypothetical protein ACJMQP_09220 [Rhodopseudomonas palustris]
MMQHFGENAECGSMTRAASPADFIWRCSVDFRKKAQNAKSAADRIIILSKGKVWRTALNLTFCSLKECEIVFAAAVSDAIGTLASATINMV